MVKRRNMIHPCVIFSKSPAFVRYFNNFFMTIRAFTLYLLLAKETLASNSHLAKGEGMSDHKKGLNWLNIVAKRTIKG